MSETTYDEYQLIHAARERIRRDGDAVIVSIEDLLDELSEQFGDRVPVSDTVSNAGANPYAVGGPACRPGDRHGLYLVRLERAGARRIVSRASTNGRSQPAPHLTSEGIDDFERAELNTASIRGDKQGAGYGQQ